MRASREDLGVFVALRAQVDGGCRFVHPRPTANGELGEPDVGEGRVTVVHANDGVAAVSANDVVRTLLAVRRQCVGGQAVAGQTLAAGDPSTLEPCEREAWQPTHVHHVGSQNHDGANGNVVRTFDVGKLFVSVGLELVDDHRQHPAPLHGLHVPRHRCRLGGRIWRENS